LIVAKVHFKAKPQTIYNMDETVAYVRIKVPALTRSHCDFAAFRSHPKFGPYANSDLFASLLKRALGAAGVGEYLRLDKPLPENVTIDASGFLHAVTIDL
jgi:hypothetical protein